jgi:D-alanine-D-alanine ligase
MPPKKTHVGLIYGGLSSEHEVSVASARNVFAALDSAGYRVTPIRIDREGRWHAEDPMRSALRGPEADPDASSAQILFAPAEAARLFVERGAGEPREPLALDVAFVMLHGQNGEDGRVQGLLHTVGIPYTGADVLASASCMDKEVTKRQLRDAGLPIVPFRVIRYGQHLAFEEATAALGLPLFVKPANSGSSVGTSKVEDEAQFTDAVTEAFNYDNKVLVETAVTGREIECAVLGNEEPRASTPGEVVSTAAFYTYDAKYEDADAAHMEVPADIPDAVAARIRSLATDAYRVLGCEGMARVDFFVTPEHEVFVNEINTIPGFTERSMYPVMWEHEGLSAEQLADTLIQLAFDRHARDARLKTTR